MLEVLMVEGISLVSFRYYWQCLSKSHLFSKCRCTKAVPCTAHAKQVKLVLFSHSLVNKLWLNTTLRHIQNTTSIISLFARVCLHWFEWSIAWVYPDVRWDLKILKVTVCLLPFKTLEEKNFFIYLKLFLLRLWNQTMI